MIKLLKRVIKGLLVDPHQQVVKVELIKTTVAQSRTQIGYHVKFMNGGTMNFLITRHQCLKAKLSYLELLSQTIETYLQRQGINCTVKLDIKE